jgi:hypothetical protein
MSLRRTFHSGKRWLQFLLIILLLTIAFGVRQTQVAQAATINVPCNVTALVALVTFANGNGEADTLNLASGCTYTLTATLTINADGGSFSESELTIEGNGATISGNNAVQVFNVTTGATLNLNAVTVSNGAVGLTSGFFPDPFAIGMTAGGPVDVSYPGSGCNGFTTSAPAYRAEFTSGSVSSLLRFYFKHQP